MHKLLTLILLVFCFSANAQRGIKGNITITANNTIVNEYTLLTANAATGATSITVSDNSLDSNASRFSTPLAAGDLLFIYQAQGAQLNGVLSGGIGIPDDGTWGAVTNYAGAGNYEFVEVAGTSGTNIIQLNCGLKNDYSTSGKTQVIRVPRYENLTVNASAGITTYNWNGSSGGIVVIEVNGTANINGSISASGKGFRGGVLDPNSNFNPHYATLLDVDGAMKGESIAGYQSDYTSFGGMYCMAAPANGGGGGNAHNAGGGGGANGGDPLLWDGLGNPSLATANWSQAWNLESAGFATHTSSGGGRGGYSFSQSNQNALTLGPGQAAWGGDNRKIYGGYGGRPMDYSSGKIFFGGGGGAGDQNEGYGGAGGNGGGIVFIQSHGTVSGTGNIVSNGNNGNSTLTPTPNISNCTGKDAAGGAGGGGCVIINSNNSISGISITANGGTGGNQNQSCGVFASGGEAYGPGGGGGGGYIAVSNGAITRTANGGDNGISTASALSEFTPNGATRGASGTNNALFDNFHLDVPVDTINICSSSTATFTANVTGTLPAGTSIVWYSSAYGNTSVGTGLSFTTPVLAANTTYYVGFCPGFYRIPVTVIVGSSPVINSAGIVISDATCAGNDGSITGITVSGASSLTWNGNPSATADLSGVGAGSYTLVATGAGGCTTSAGPFTIASAGGPVINTGGIAITPTSCGLNNGAITGITASGSGTLSYTWNGSPNSDADTLMLAAGNYTLTVTDGNGCSASSGPHTINSSSGPVLNSSAITITPATCGSSNGSITGITLSGGTPTVDLFWNGNPSVGTDLNAVSGGIYTLTVTDGAGCTTSAGPFTISSTGGSTIDDSNVTVTSTTCGNNNGSISGILISGGTAPLTIEYNGTVYPGADVTGLAAGSYSLVVTDNSGCISNAGPYIVDPSSEPSLTATGLNPVCFGENSGSVSASASGGSGTISYQWVGGPATANYNNIPAGTYTVIASDANGCDDTTSVTINDPAEIIAAISGTTLICAGQSTTLTATGASNFMWSTGDNTASITVTPGISSTYSVVVSDGTCSDSAGIVVTVNDLPVASISGDSVLCPGESTLLTANGGLTYLWSTGDTTSTLNYTGASATISVTVSNNCGNDTESIAITINTSPVADAGADVSIALGSGTTLTGNGGVTYSWTPSDGLNSTNTQSTYASPLITTSYTLTVTDVNGCTASDEVTVIVDFLFVVFVPDAFSPNGDGNNDELFVRGAGIAEIEFSVYDRWGQLVFRSTDLNTGWNGEFKNKALDAGVFVYTLEGKFMNGDQINQKGNITLHR